MNSPTKYYDKYYDSENDHYSDSTDYDSDDNTPMTVYKISKYIPPIKFEMDTTNENSDDGSDDNEITYTDAALFPNSKFHVCIPDKKLNKLLTSEHSIIVSHEGRHIKIMSDHMTYKYVIDELIYAKLDPIGDHRFLEEILQVPKNPTHFKLWFGS